MSSGTPPRLHACPPSDRLPTAATPLRNTPLALQALDEEYLKPVFGGRQGNEGGRVTGLQPQASYQGLPEIQMEPPQLQPGPGPGGPAH